jgi:signal transduction histidine kinase
VSHNATNGSGDRCSLGQPDCAVVALPDGTRTFDQKLTTETKPRWSAWREVPGRSSIGERIETQCDGRDVTDRVRAEHASTRDQADAANRAKSQFRAMVSDETRKPMNSILGDFRTGSRFQSDPEQAAEVRAIKASAEARRDPAAASAAQCLG